MGFIGLAELGSNLELLNLRNLVLIFGVEGIMLVDCRLLAFSRAVALVGRFQRRVLGLLVRIVHVLVLGMYRRVMTSVAQRQF